MSMPSTKSKMKYNRAAYRRYEFNLRMDSKLTAIIERYKSNPENHLSSLIKELLCRYFGMDINEANDLFPPYHFGPNGVHIPNKGLDKYFPLDTVKEKLT